MGILFENIQLALEAIRANKMRSLLTMLGIIIGIGSVIGIVTVGDSLTNAFSSEMQSLGSSNIYIYLSMKDSESNYAYYYESDMITDDMVDQYLDLYGDEVEAVSLEAYGDSGKATDGRLYANVNVSGVSEGSQAVNNITLTSGRFIRESDVKGKRYVCVVSDKFVNNMFGSNVDPLGKEVKITTNNELQTFTIVGVYQYEQSAFNITTASEKDITTSLYIPVSTCKQIMGDYDGYDQIIAMAKTGVDTMEFASNAKYFFNTFYENNAQWKITTMNMESMIDTITSMMGIIETAIAVIAGISLLVGGIGVMNIMLVSVTERTREIGTRKALGARNSSIRVQFIVESIIICTIGGVIGIAIGLLLGYAGSSVLGFPGLPSVDIIIIAVAFSMIIGTFFGYYPANKAAKLDPIEALRYE